MARSYEIVDWRHARIDGVVCLVCPASGEMRKVDQLMGPLRWAGDDLDRTLCIADLSGDWAWIDYMDLISNPALYERFDEYSKKRMMALGERPLRPQV